MRKTVPQPFPFLEKPIDEAGTALRSSHAIASVGIATLTMLETLLPVAATEVERASQSLSDHFTTLVQFVEKQMGTADELSCIMMGAPVRPAAANLPKEVAEAVSGVIMGMQFQDRNTQIMENVAGMLERYRSMLEDICSNIDSMREGDTHADHDVTQAVDSILSGIRLSDIRSRYLQALSKAKVHGHANNLTVVEEEPCDEIELF